MTPKPKVKKIKVIGTTGLLVSIFLAFILGGGLGLGSKNQIVNPQVINTTSTITETCGTSETVYFLSDKEVKLLPFCGLNYNYQTGKPYNEDFCYDWAGWNNHTGIAIINLKK